MTIAAPPSIVEPWAASGDRPLVPVADPGGGGASFDLGWPPITQQPRISGGIPPNRPNENGILFMLSSHTCYLIGGGSYLYSSGFSTKQTGYGAGAVLGSTSGIHKRWMSVADSNTNDPDSVATNWAPFCPDAQPLAVQTATPSGAVASITLGTGTGWLDVTPGSDATLDSILGAYDGQNVIVTNLHATRLFTLTAAGNFRLPSGGLTLLQNMAARLTWSATLGVWSQT